MTPDTHNRTIGLINGLVGALTMTGLIIGAVLEIRRRPLDAIERLAWMLYVLPLPLLQLLTAYGLFAKRNWGRILALILSVLYIWIFPLGTLLAIYTWYFFQGAAGKQLFDKTTT